jgi:hypothetical protein
MTLRFATNLLAVVLLLFGSQCSWAAWQEPEAAESDSTASVPAESAVSDPAVDPAVDPAIPAEKTWMEKIDKVFGDYLVTPVGKVIFYDFGSGPVKNEAGVVTEKGWLQTDGSPDGVSIPFVVAWLFCGATFLTLRMGFINFRGFWHAIRLTRGDYDDADEPGMFHIFKLCRRRYRRQLDWGTLPVSRLRSGWVDREQRFGSSWSACSG